MAGRLTLLIFFKLWNSAFISLAALSSCFWGGWRQVWVVPPAFRSLLFWYLADFFFFLFKLCLTLQRASQTYIRPINVWQWNDMPGSWQPSLLTCQKELRIEQARKPHHCCWQHKVLCPDLKFFVSHEKISNAKRKAAIASALISLYYFFIDKINGTLLQV